MKKTLICSLLAIATASFATESQQGMSIDMPSSASSVSTKTVTTKKTPKTMDAMPMNKNFNKDDVQPIDQPKQPEQLVGSNAATWTPKYLEVKDFKKCLGIQEYRGWEGYCMPKKKLDECPTDSWKSLQKMNLVPCSKD
jgi:hypothetical protein